jgi:hypothetical protein
MLWEIYISHHKERKVRKDLSAKIIAAMLCVICKLCDELLEHGSRG